MHLNARPPFPDGLVVDQHVRLGEEGDETVVDAEFDGGGLGVLGAAGAPEVERSALAVEVADVCDDCGDGDAFVADGSDEGVVDIDIDDEGLGHGLACFGGAIGGDRRDARGLLFVAVDWKSLAR